MYIKYIHYFDKKISALYYRSANTLYYNVNFKAKFKLIVIK